MKTTESLKKNLIHLLAAVILAAGVLAVGQLISCNKTQAPLGFYAPNGYDVPAGPGTFTVSVLDTTPIQGVTLYMLDPLGNTVGPVLSSSNYGVATFGVKNVTNGVWNAFLPTQGVSYVTGSGSNAVTVHHYFYNSYQPVTMLNSNQASISFYTDMNGINNAVTLLPVTQTSSYNIYPFSAAVTAAYLQSGNLNVPVSIALYIETYTGLNISPSAFILGEGVTQQAVTVSLNTCFANGIAVTIGANDFTGAIIANSSSSVTVNRNYGITVKIYAFASPPTYLINLTASEDCGATFNYSVDSTNKPYANLGRGTFTSGETISFTDSNTNDNVNFTISSPVTPNYGCNMNLESMSTSGLNLYPGSCANSSF